MSLGLPVRKSKLGRPKKNPEDVGLYSKRGIAIPDYLFDKLEQIEKAGINFSKAALEVLRIWDEDPDFFSEITVSKSGKYFKQKVIYVSQENTEFFERLHKVFQNIPKDSETGFRLKMSYVIVNGIYKLKFGEE